jgi:hypothetical protein
VSQLVALPGGGQLDLSKIPAGERERVMAGLERVLEANPLDRFFPHSGPQKEFLAAQTPVVFVGAGNRFGKTTVGIVKDLIDCLDEDQVPAHLRPFKRWQPPFFCRIIIPAFGLLEEGVFAAIREWCPPSALVGDSFDKAYTEGPPRKLRFKNGSYIGFMTYEQKSDKEKKVFGSVKLHRVHYDEEPPQPIRKESQQRLVDFGGDELFTMTPQDGLGWTYREIWRKRGEAHITAVQGDAESNPHLDRATLERLWASYSDEELAYRKRGEFIHVGGFAYPTLPDRKVANPSPEHLAGQDIVVGIDPGVRFGAIVWTAFDSQNRALTFDEAFIQDASEGVENFVRVINDVNAKWGIEDPTYVIDPSAGNRNPTDGETVETELARFGIYTVPGFNNRKAGVLQIRRRLAHKSLVVAERCTGLLEEAEDYVLVERPDGSWEPEGGAGRHRLDSWRYALLFRPWLADPPEATKRGYQPGFEPAWAPMPPAVEAPMGPLS